LPYPLLSRTLLVLIVLLFAICMGILAKCVIRPARSLKRNSMLMFDCVYNNKLRIPTCVQHLAQSFFSQLFRAMGAKHSTRRPGPGLALSPSLAPASTPPRVPGLQFRVLIIGRANAGKTSILQRVCDTTESPEIYRSDPLGTRHQVCAHSQWPFPISLPIQVQLDPTTEVGWPYFCRRQLIMGLLLTAWLSQH
jgi:hypothetical protein